MSGPSSLILPVESRVRELDAKLLLAGVAAERGFPVILGSRAEVGFALPRLPRGVFFAKSMRFTSDLMTGFIRGFGHHMVASDEESLVRFDHPEYYDWRFSDRTFNSLRHVFSWGRDDAEMLRAYPKRRNVAVHATGNPRMDMLREDVREVYRSKAEALRREHGRFVMINSNFPFVNNFVPSLNLVQFSSGGEPEVSRTGRGMSLGYAMDKARHVQKIMSAFEELLPRLSERFPDHVIVLRPHPSEDHDYWRLKTSGLTNVRIIHEGSVVPWLMAAEALLHNGCTTAVEAAVLGTPAVAYLPVRSDEHDYHLPNRLSVRCDETDSVIDALSGITADRAVAPNDAARRRLLEPHLEMEPDRLAADRIVDVLQEAGYLEAPPPPPGWRAYSRACIGTRIRTTIKHINMRRPGHRNSTAYLRHRFPPLTVAEVEEGLLRLGRKLGRFDSISVRGIGQDLFSIRRHP